MTGDLSAAALADTGQGLQSNMTTYALTRLDSHQVAQAWAALRSAIGTVCGFSPKRISEILERIVSGKLQCWIGTGDDDGTTRYYGAAITGVVNHTLEIHLVYSFEAIPPGMLARGLDMLKAFARNAGCTEVVGCVENETQRAMYQRLGADTYDSNWVRFPLDEKEV